MAARRFRSCRVRSWAGPCAFPLQFRVHSAAGAAGPAAGEPHGARITWVWRHWPLASSSRAGSPYPRHLARALDFPGRAHPRQERGGARLSQHGVTAPGDDVGYVDLEGNHQVGDQDSFPPRRVAGPVSPSLHGMARAGPSRSIGPLPGGSMGFFTIIKSNIDDRVHIPVMLGTARHPSAGRRDLATGAFSLHKKGVSVGFDTILERVGWSRTWTFPGLSLDFPRGWPGRPVPLTPARCRAGRWDTSGRRRMLSAGPGPGRS